MGAGGVLGLAGIPFVRGARAENGVATPATRDEVEALALQLSGQPYVRLKIDLPPPFDRLTYEQYRDLRFRPEHAIWHSEQLHYELQLFPVGFLYEDPVDIWVVDDGKARLLTVDSDQFAAGPLLGTTANLTPPAFSGFRIHAPVNRADYYDEFVLFQGASYFRSVGRNQVYGLSARGLAINTAQPSGEEFPAFRAFWIEKPAPKANEIVVHALLDSPSTTGAYTFTIRPGDATVMDVEVTLYPRQTLRHVGLAPLTSMFLHGPGKRGAADFRPNVHDSEGLAIVNGGGERLWRPLTNPRLLQTSAFLDENPRGFGLIQRNRAFSRFADPEARYERRPSAWIEPKGHWGAGYIELIEIPAEAEIHDNIVAYWKPAADLPPGVPFKFAYRLSWVEEVPVVWAGARVRETFISEKNGGGAGGVAFAVDFNGPGLDALADLPQPTASTNGGTISNLVLKKMQDANGFRVSFDLDPGSLPVIELRLALEYQQQVVSEAWLYRWTRS